MALTEFGSGKYQEQGGITVSRRTLLPAIRWGAVFAGVVVGVSIQLVLSLLGLASGLSTLDLQQGETSSMGPLAWAGCSMLIAAFIGGYVAARMTGLKRKADGVLHGVVAWAVTTLLFASLATSGGGLLGSVFHGVTPALERSQALQRAPQGVAPAGGLLGLLRNQLGSNIQPEMLEKLRQTIVAGQRDEAVEYMVTALGVEPSRAQTVVDQAMILSGSAEQASAQGKGRADQAGEAASSAAWTVFLAVALSLAMGILGGVLGAIGARRTTWMEEAVATSTPPDPR